MRELPCGIIGYCSPRVPQRKIDDDGNTIGNDRRYGEPASGVLRARGGENPFAAREVAGTIHCFPVSLPGITGCHTALLSSRRTSQKSQLICHKCSLCAFCRYIPVLTLSKLFVHISDFQMPFYRFSTELIVFAVHTQCKDNYAHDPESCIQIWIRPCGKHTNILLVK